VLYWWRVFVAAWSRSAVTFAIVALGVAAIAHLALRWWVRRKAGQQQAQAEAGLTLHRARVWVARGLRTVLAPLALLIWVQALWLVARMIAARAAAPPYAESALLWAYRLSLVAGLFWLLLRLGRLVDDILTSLSARTALSWDDLQLPAAGKAARRGLPLLALILAKPILSASPALAAVIGDATSLALIALVSFVLYQIVDASAEFVLSQHRIDIADNLQARAVYTQVAVLKKVAIAAIGVFTVASMLMVFDSVRQFGASILASAGIAGIVVGFAAQRSIATLLAGFQIAMTQPIRVDDVVIVEGEWGRIEEITLTYVVVKIWDLRRLVVPITYFIEQPFQNWTRTSSAILGTVFLYVDYTMPIEPLRGELTRILEGSKKWDRQVNVLQVTDAKEQTLEIRALASAADASLAWDLRCEIREQLIAFVREHYPASLPRFRASLESLRGDAH
jgi:small-conductance mechanosensitive channel